MELPYLREQQQPRLRRRRCRHLTPRRRGSKLSNVAAAIGHDSPNIVSLDDDDTDVKDSATIIGSGRVTVVVSGALVAAPSARPTLRPQQIQAG